MRAPGDLVVGRAQRREWIALPVSRLEIRLDRPVHRRAIRTAGKRLLPEDQAEILCAGEARRRALGLYGCAGATAGFAGIRIRDCEAHADLHLQAPAGMQLVAGARGRDRLQSYL